MFNGVLLVSIITTSILKVTSLPKLYYQNHQFTRYIAVHKTAPWVMRALPFEFSIPRPLTRALHATPVELASSDTKRRKCDLNTRIKSWNLFFCLSNFGDSVFVTASWDPPVFEAFSPWVSILSINSNQFPSPYVICHQSYSFFLWPTNILLPTRIFLATVSA